MHELHHHLFPSIEGMEQRDEQAENTREFKGDGTRYLKVPGCKRVEGVRVGPAQMPATIAVEYPVDMSMRRLERKELPCWHLAHAADGTPILLRASMSNDGIWQDGVSIWVTGAWEDTLDPTLTPAPDSLIETVEAVKPRGK